MLQETLKQLPLDELLILLSTAQKNLTLSKLYNHGANVIEHNKNHLEKVQKAIVEKRSDPLPQE